MIRSSRFLTDRVEKMRTFFVGATLVMLAFMAIVISIPMNNSMTVYAQDDNQPTITPTFINDNVAVGDIRNMGVHGVGTPIPNHTNVDESEFNPELVMDVSLTDDVQMRISAYPFPLRIGPTTVNVELLTADGEAISGATVDMRAIMDHDGMLPIFGQKRPEESGTYPLRTSFTMAGQWLMSITATMPDGTSLTETFDGYVFPVPPFDFDTSDVVYFPSIDDANASMSVDPEREQWIVLPQGTLAMLQQGHQIMPDEINLSLSGQDTIVIRNNDLYDHTVGPYYIRSGETVRQTFTRAMIYQGVCTVSNVGYINIVVTD